MASSFGSWAVEADLPVFRERLHPDDPRVTWDPVVAPATNQHWCAFGNRRLQVVADNLGGHAVRDTARQVRWLTRRHPGTGVVVIGGRWGTDHARWPASWSTAAPIRTWGPTWSSLAGGHDGVSIDQMVALPEGERPWVLVRIRQVSSTGTPIEVTAEWTVPPGIAAIDGHGATVGDVRAASSVPDVRVAVDTDGTVRLTRTLTSGATWWLHIGLPGEDEEPVDHEAMWSASLAALRDRLPSGSCGAVPALEREIPWHAAMLTGGACVDATLGGHTLDQGSAYSFDLDFNGAARDPLQHALPLVYIEPDLALSVLRNTCAWAGPDGALPYAIDANKQPITEWFTPSDQTLWSLWLAVEYVAATGDLDALGEPAPFHPVHEARPVPLVEHLVGQFRHLVDGVGVGPNGHIRILNADWNDSALTLAGIDRAVMEERGESVLNSAMAAWVLPRFAGMLRRLGDDRWRVVADEADTLAARWRELVATEWNGRWFRRARGPGAVVGDDELWLEVQPWAILCGAAEDGQARDLLCTIDRLLRRDSPLGARLRGPVPIRVPEDRVPGEGSAGGIWPSVNMTLAWAAASFAPELAWDELRRMTLAAHADAYPAIWEGTISGPDAYNSVESPRAGATWAWPDRGIGMQSFPVNNLHAHAQVLLTYLRLLGVEPTVEGKLSTARGGGTFRSRTFDVNG